MDSPHLHSFHPKKNLKEKFTNLLHYNWLLGSYNLESRERISAAYALHEFRFLCLQQKSSVKWLAWKYYTKYCRLHSFHLKLLSMLDIRLGEEVGKDAHFYGINNNDNNWKAPCAGAKSSCQVHQCDEGKIMYFNLIGKGTYLFAQSSTALHFLTLIKSFETSMLVYYLCMRWTKLYFFSSSLKTALDVFVKRFAFGGSLVKCSCNNKDFKRIF